MNGGALDGHGFDSRTTDEQREIARRGGVASGQSRRRRAAARAALRTMLEMPLPAERLAEMAEMGLATDDADYQAAMLAALVRRAIDGNIQAIQLIVTITGDDPYAAARAADVKLRRAELAERRREHDQTHALRRDEFECKQRASTADGTDWAAMVETAYDYNAAREEAPGMPDHRK